MCVRERKREIEGGRKKEKILRMYERFKSRYLKTHESWSVVGLANRGITTEGAPK